MVQYENQMFNQIKRRLFGENSSSIFGTQINQSWNFNESNISFESFWLIYAVDFLGDGDLMGNFVCFGRCGIFCVENLANSSEKLGN
jgi:hypothetical protein